MASSARAGVPASRRAAGPPSSSRLSPRLDARIATARRPRPPASASLASASAGRGGRGFPPRHPSRPRERVRANALEAEDAARPRAASSSSYAAAPSGARAPNPPLGGRDARARDDADDDGDPLLRIVPPSSRAAPGGAPPRAAGRSSAAVVRRGASLADYCTLGVGGEARALVEARTSDALRAALASARRAHLPVVVIGRGSNVLFRDEGFEGVVVVNKIEHVERVLPNAEEDDARTSEEGEEQGRSASSGASSKASETKKAPQTHEAPPREKAPPPQKARFRAGAGCAFHRLGAALSRAGWSGLEFAVGIPGTVGGAVFMNAGADGRETRDALVEIEAVSPDGGDFATIPVDARFSRRDAEDAFASAFGYRTSPFMEEEASASSSLGVSSAESSSSETNEKNASASSRRYEGWIVTAATFELTRDPNAAKRAAASIRRRRETQPLAERSTGCAFRNPGAGADSAGALIDRSGLKGAAIGRASVSKAHANFLLVRHSADFEGEEKRGGNDDGCLSGGGSGEYSALIARVRAEVFERTGVWLEEEVRRVGRFGVERAPEKPLSKETRAREEGAAGDERMRSEERRRRGDDDDDETRRSARVAAASDAALEAFLSAVPGLAEGPGNAPPNPR